MLAAGVLVCSAAHADAAAERFAEIVKNTPAVDETQCSYTIVGESDERVLEERFTAQADQAWQLVKVDGADPSAEAVEEYADSAEQRSRRGHPMAFDLARLARVDTVQLAREDVDTVTFSFRLQPAEDEENPEFVEKMRGRLIASKADLRPLTFITENAEPFSPAAAFKILEFRQEMTFRYDETLKTSVAVRTKTHFLAKAFVFKTINDDRIVEFLDYDCR